MKFILIFLQPHHIINFYVSHRIWRPLNKPNSPSNFQKILFSGTYIFLHIYQQKSTKNYEKHQILPQKQDNPVQQKYEFMKDQLVISIFGKYQIYICVMIHNIHFNLFWILILFLRPPTVISLLVVKVTKSTIYGPLNSKLIFQGW